MKVNHFDHITIAVNDLNAAIETFTRCFNLKAKDRLKRCGVRVIEHKDADGDRIAMMPPKDMHGVMIEIGRGKRLIREFKRIFGKPLASPASSAAR